MGKASQARREKREKLESARFTEGLVKKARFYDFALTHYGDLIRSEGGVIDINSVVQTFGSEITRDFDNDPSVAVLRRFQQERLSLRPPFGQTWIEFNSSSYIPELNLHNSVDYGVHIDFPDELNDGGSYTVWVGMFGRGRAHGTFELLGNTFLILDEQGQLLRYPFNRDAPTNFAVWLILAFVFQALALMNCRNIELVDREPDAVTQQQYERKFGQPMTKYKVLRLKPMGKRHEGSDDPQGEFDIMPLHLRRGNFATYTDDAPLFGKYTGTFWRPATAVGNAKNGIVVKDYEIATA